MDTRIKKVVKLERWDVIMDIHLKLTNDGQSWIVLYQDYMTECLFDLYRECTLYEACKVCDEWVKSGEPGARRISRQSTPEHYTIIVEEE